MKSGMARRGMVGRRLRRRSGIIAFFEDMPALIVVLIGISVFLVSVVNAYVGYVQGQKEMAMGDKASDFLRAIRSCGSLVRENKEGMFDSAKLAAMKSETFAALFVPDALGYNYIVTVLDKSAYPGAAGRNRVWKSAEAPDGAGRFSATTSACIWVASGEIHAASVSVTIWGNA